MFIQKIKDYMKRKEEARLEEFRKIEEEFLEEQRIMREEAIEDARKLEEIRQLDEEIAEIIADIRAGIDKMEDSPEKWELKEKFEKQVKMSQEAENLL